MAIHREPSAAITVALGLAPPNEEPGARSWLSHFSSSPLSSFSKARLADSNFLSVTHGGVASAVSSDKKGPFSCMANRSAPILAPS